MKHISQQVKAQLEQATSVAIFGHPSTDGDCLGSMFGLGKLLEKKDKKVHYYIPDDSFTHFDYLPDINSIQMTCDYPDVDLIVFVDFSPAKRIKPFVDDKPDYFANHTVIVIDHHPEEVPSFVDYTLKDPEVISNCLWLFEYFQKRERTADIDPSIATYLYLGLTTDSGNFQYEKEHIRTFTGALQLLELGADKTWILEQLTAKSSLHAVKFLGLLIERFTLHDDILYVRFKEEELEQHQMSKEKSDAVFDIMRRVQEAKLFIRFYEKDDILKISLRTQQFDDSINCGKIARHFDGGGHEKAAGCGLPRTDELQQQINIVLKEISKLLPKQ